MIEECVLLELKRVERFRKYPKLSKKKKKNQNILESFQTFIRTFTPFCLVVLTLL